MNGTDSQYSFIPFKPAQGLFPGYARIAVVLTSSIQALIKSPQQYERSYHKRQLTVFAYYFLFILVYFSIYDSIN